MQGLVRMLHDETENGPVRVSALEPGPMRTNIRSRAFVEEAATLCPSPSLYAAACVHLLSEAGRDRRGEIWAPRVEARKGASV
jgi:short-subunit dehydrogenase